MTGDSSLVFRWEIDSATAALNKAESKVFKEGGFEWKAGFQPAKKYEVGRNDLDGTLTCVHPDGRDWSCEVDVKYIIKCKPNDMHYEKRIVKFDHVCGTYTIPNMLNSVLLRDANNQFHFDDKVIVEFHINVINSQCPPPIDLTKFAANGMGNVVLAIGDKKVNVSKEFLAVHSPVFAAMFFGDYAEKGKEEVEIKDVVYEEFLDLLQLIHFRTVEITDRTVSHILKLADRFQIEHVIDQSVKHLMQSKGIDVVKKLHLADQYRLASLKEQCIKSFTCVADLAEKLKSSPESANFSAELKTEIFDLLLKI